MGQSRLSSDNLLTNRVVELEQEVKSLKVSQPYLTGQIQWQTTNSLEISSRLSHLTYWHVDSQAIWVRLVFEGQYKDRTAIGFPVLDSLGFAPQNTNYGYGIISLPDSALPPHSFAIIYASNSEDASTAYTSKISVVANMPGVLKLDTWLHWSEHT